jgi:hypothetical protein
LLRLALRVGERSTYLPDDVKEMLDFPFAYRKRGPESRPHRELLPPPTRWKASRAVAVKDVLLSSAHMGTIRPSVARSRNY